MLVWPLIPGASSQGGHPWRNPCPALDPLGKGSPREMAILKAFEGWGGGGLGDSLRGKHRGD